MALASLNRHKVVAPKEDKVPDVNLKPNTTITDVPDTTTPWVETSSVSTTVERFAPMSGFPWGGTYFQQLRGIDDYSDVLDDLISAPYQQYARINGYELLLETPLTQSTAVDSKVTSADIEAVVSDTLVPNRGDCFLADIGDGRLGLFVATETNRKTIFNSTAYDCKFSLYKIIKDESDSILTDIASKVVVNYHYNKQYLELGKEPLLTTDELDKYSQRSDIANYLTTSYINTYKVRVMSTLALTVGEVILYDPSVIDFMYKTTKNFPNDLHQYTPNDVEPKTIYDMLISRHQPQYKNTLQNKKVYIECVTGMDISYRFGLMHTPCTHIATNECVPIYYGYTSNYKPNIHKLSDIISHDSVKVPTPLIGTALPPFPDVIGNETYIFSREWYEENKATSLLETMVDDWLRRRPADPRKITTIIEAVDHLDVVSKYYLVPIIIFLLTYSK